MTDSQQVCGWIHSLSQPFWIWGENVYCTTRANCRRAEKYWDIMWKGPCPFALAQHTEKFGILPNVSSLCYSSVVESDRSSCWSTGRSLRPVGWPTLAWRRRRIKLLFLWDLLNKQGPPDLSSDLPKLASERADYSDPSAPSLAFPRCLMSKRLKSFLPASIELFQSLPASVSSCFSRSSFLFALDRHFSKDIFSFGLT